MGLQVSPINNMLLAGTGSNLYNDLLKYKNFPRDIEILGWCPARLISRHGEVLL